MKLHAKKLWEITKCPECFSEDLVEDCNRGELICQSCGLVINEHIMNIGPEWRAFTKEEKESRVRAGTPVYYSMFNKGLSTVIDRINRDAYGRKLPLSTRIRMLRLRQWQIRTQTSSSTNKNLAQSMTELNRLVDNLHIPFYVKERAALIYRKALDNGLVRGRSAAGVIAAALYAACRIAEIPRTLKEVAFVSGINKEKYIARCYRALLQGLDIRVPLEDPIRCVPKIASKLKIPLKTQRIAIKILLESKRRGIASGKEPMGLAGSVLYIASLLNNEKISQKEISKVANITEVTLRNRNRDLKKVLKINICPYKNHK